MKKTPFWWRGKKRKTLPGSLERNRAVLLEKFDQRRTAAGYSGHVTGGDRGAVSIDRVLELIQQAQRAAFKSGVPRPRFPFEAGDVVAIHLRHRDEGKGIWFRLADGRVFRDTGEPSPASLDHYD